VKSLALAGKAGSSSSMLQRCLYLLLTITYTAQLLGQADSSRQKRPIDANFLLSYYQQDGQHSAVTGGRGTEELSDIATRLTLIIPVDTLGSLEAGITVNRYSSASTDMIDSRISSASADDIRAAWHLGWLQAENSKGRSYGYSLGGSVESDYVSTSLHGNYYTPLGKNQQQALFIDGQVFLDRWVLYFPGELRDTIQPHIDTDRRFSYHLDVQYQWVVNRRLQLSLSAGLSHQQGLLSTPFHRVYFPGEELPRIERLPNQKWKFPLGVRLHYFLGSSWVIRSFYRYYRDDWGMNAHSFNLELPWKASTRWTLTPIYRYHSQQAANYFQPFAMHLNDADYYTSDFDLSSLHSHKLGLGFRFTPFWKWNWRRLGWNGQVRSIGIRLVHYRRSDGLTSWAITSLWQN